MVKLKVSSNAYIMIATKVLPCKSVFFPLFCKPKITKRGFVIMYKQLMYIYCWRNYIRSFVCNYRKRKNVIELTLFFLFNPFWFFAFNYSNNTLKRIYIL